MNNILKFARKPVSKRSVLCVNNHHKWEIVNEQQFDVKLGKLVTVEKCKRCSKQRTRLI